MRLSILELEDFFKIAKFKNSKIPILNKNQNPRNFFVFWATRAIHTFLESSHQTGIIRWGQNSDIVTGLGPKVQFNIYWWTHCLFCAKIQCLFRKHYRAFLHYLEEAEPKIASHTSYMRNMYKHVLKVVETLENCGYEKLITFCHGDAKPNNFLFRSIEIDIEDLECEGLQSILIDWQGGFLGSAANDLMWALFPFLEAHTEDKVL